MQGPGLGNDPGGGNKGDYGQVVSCAPLLPAQLQVMIRRVNPGRQEAQFRKTGGGCAPWGWWWLRLAPGLWPPDKTIPRSQAAASRRRLHPGLFGRGRGRKPRGRAAELGRGGNPRSVPLPRPLPFSPLPSRRNREVCHDRRRPVRVPRWSLERRARLVRYPL